MAETTAKQRALLSLDGLSLGDAFGERFFGPLHEVLARIGRQEIAPTVSP